MTGVIRKVTRAVGIGLVVAALAACTGGGADDRPGPDESPVPNADAAPSPEVSERPAPGPLDVYAGYGKSLQTPQEMAAELTRQENSIATCMAAQGFDYTPQVPAVNEITAVEGPIPGTRSFVEEYGYGIWASPPEGTGGGFEWTNPEDPNADRRAAMSEAEGAAYDAALWGPVIETDGSTITRGGGCFDATYGPVAADDLYLAGVLAEVWAFLGAIGDDSRFGDVDAAWGSCMADAGFSYRNPAAAQQQFLDEVGEAYGEGGMGPERAVVGEHAVEERRVAVADLDCQGATDWVARHRAIEIALQQEYVDAHLADLEALGAAMGAPSTTG